MNKLDKTTRQLLRDPRKRRAWVKYQFQLRGISMAEVAASAKPPVSRQCIYDAFNKTYPRMEKLIADALGLRPADIWPDRYDADGLPIYRIGRPKKSISSSRKDNSRSAQRNVSQKGPGRQEAA